MLVKASPWHVRGRGAASQAPGSELGRLESDLALSTWASSVLDDRPHFEMGASG